MKRIFFMKPIFILISAFVMTQSSIAEEISSSSSPTEAPRRIILAGGCFWCLQPPFDALKSQGVLSTSVGYSGGNKKDPSYEEVSSGTTGHKEVIQVTYDSKRISLAKILETFWVNVDPLDERGQFCDMGEQYQSAIYYSDDSEKKIAEASVESAKKKIKVKGNFATQILRAKEFYPAEEYHQSYYTKNKLKYKFYRYSCGRDKRLKEVWGSPQ